MNTSQNPPAIDPPRALILRLAEWLRGTEGLTVEADITDPVLKMELDGRVDHATCRAREEDGGRLWFFDGSGQPVCEADNIADAALAFRARLIASADAKT